MRCSKHYLRQSNPIDSSVFKRLAQAVDTYPYEKPSCLYVWNTLRMKIADNVNELTRREWNLWL